MNICWIETWFGWLRMIALKLEKRWNRVSICRTPERQKGEPSNSSKVLRMLHRLFIAACLFSLPILCWPDPADGPKSSGFTLRPLCPVSHCPIEDKGGLLASQPEKGRILTVLFVKQIGLPMKKSAFCWNAGSSDWEGLSPYPGVRPSLVRPPKKLMFLFWWFIVRDFLLPTREPLWMPHNTEFEVHHRNVSAKFVNEICHRKSSLKAGLSPSPQTPHTFYLWHFPVCLSCLRELFGTCSAAWKNHEEFGWIRYIAVNQRMRSLDKRWTCPVGMLRMASFRTTSFAMSNRRRDPKLPTWQGLWVAFETWWCGTSSLCPGHWDGCHYGTMVFS